MIKVAVGAVEAAAAASRQEVVVIVDIIDMSTTLESAMEAGATAVYGAAPWPPPEYCRVCPEAVGRAAGLEARERGSGVVVVAEPRAGPARERRRQAAGVLAGLRQAGAEVVAVVPNMGKETARVADFEGKVVVAVTAAGGVAFDAAFNQGGRVGTATVARTLRSRGKEPALRGAGRAWAMSGEGDKGITVVAAGPGCLEDLLAAQYVAQLLWDRWTAGLNPGGSA
ncbi:MAG: hypothetical protein D9V47_03005 [Clostridia bacterium]|nr:MAG: hypothetical protein D9V47_03005 [Clostridia bacterium]